jgi:hypothetical protein
VEAVRELDIGQAGFDSPAYFRKQWTFSNDSEGQVRQLLPGLKQSRNAFLRGESADKDR